MIRTAVTIFSGAFLLFLVQPMIGKYILPWFGGGAGVWSACLVFFQVMLLLGYAYAHAVNRLLRPRGQAVVHMIVVVAALAFVPIIPNGEIWRPTSGDEPALRIVLLLLACLGVPYLALAATGPLMQAWFTKAHPGVSPYRLYALSNLGSFLALLGYPFVIEPAMSRKDQAIMWAIGYAAFALASGACAIGAWRLAPVLPPTIEKPDRTTAGQGPTTAFHRAMWVLLPAFASVLLVSFTARLSEDITPVPLLWIVPLAVYLLTFIVAFEWPRLYHRGAGVVGMVVAFGLIVLLGKYYEVGIFTHAAGLMAAMFFLALACHGEVYRMRPAAANLTGYYLAIAAGGALGGVFAAVIAPLVFTFNLESYLAMFGTFAAVMACLMVDERSAFFRGAKWPLWGAVSALVIGAAVVLRSMHLDFYSTAVYRGRNFYGTLSVNTWDFAGDRPCFSLQHGRVIHGAQIADEQFLHWPTTYYGPNSGAGLVLQHFPGTGQRPRNIGVVGLGVGTLAAYGHVNDHLVFYELNPQVIDLARDRFVFLKGAAAQFEIVPGDARLSMEREQSRQFDILVLDAFNGDAIPVHLLTIEAMDIYRRHLKPDGAMLVNVSNSFLQLERVLARLAQELHWEVRLFESDDDLANALLGASWVMLTTNRELLEVGAVKKSAQTPPPNLILPRMWTDDHASVAEILR